jgi:molybdopterin converting factor small subunit
LSSSTRFAKAPDNGEDGLEQNPDRRNLLKTIVLIAVGVGIAGLGTTSYLELLKGSKSPPSKQSVSSLPNSVTNIDTVANTSTTNNENSTYVTIKVVYFGMATQSTGTKQEYFVLQSPVYLENLLSQIKQKHVVAGPMLTTMQIMIDGNPTQGNPQLMDHDEVDFIPILAGG